MSNESTETDTLSATPEYTEPTIGSDSVSSRPSDVPEKFWDSEIGSVRTEILLKSYNELETRLGDPTNGIPDHADSYELSLDHPVIDSDRDVNARLHAAGFSQQQAQLVYDLAKEKLLPIIQGISDTATQGTQTTQLEHHFGGQKTWQETSRQIDNWGRANLSAEVFSALSSNYDGIIALHKMMVSKEPSIVSQSSHVPSGVRENDLKHLMRDPRYWRDHDPSIVAQVRKGFERLYPE